MMLTQLGEHGPQLMFIMSLPILWTKQLLLNYFLVGVCLSMILNSVLKYIFKHPRPNTQMRTFDANVKNTT
jgi:hypothetical protein